MRWKLFVDGTVIATVRIGDRGLVVTGSHAVAVERLIKSQVGGYTVPLLPVVPAPTSPLWLSETLSSFERRGLVDRVERVGRLDIPRVVQDDDVVH